MRLTRAARRRLSMCLCTLLLLPATACFLGGRAACARQPDYHAAVLAAGAQARAPPPHHGMRCERPEKASRYVRRWVVAWLPGALRARWCGTASPAPLRACTCLGSGAGVWEQPRHR